MVNGERHEPEISGGVYSIRLRITRQTIISVTAALLTFTVRINRGEGITLVTPQTGAVEYGREFRATFYLNPGFGNPAITGGDAVIEENTILVPSVTSDMELVISASPVTGVGENIRQRTKVYPNPVVAGQTLTVNFPNEAGLLQLYEATGKSVEKKNIGGGIEEIVIHLPGVYLLKIKTEEEEEVHKIVVQ
jgi:hypothetical protein